MDEIEKIMNSSVAKESTHLPMFGLKNTEEGWEAHLYSSIRPFGVGRKESPKEAVKELWEQIDSYLKGEW